MGTRFEHRDVYEFGQFYHKYRAISSIYLFCLSCGSRNLVALLVHRDQCSATQLEKAGWHLKCNSIFRFKSHRFVLKSYLSIC